MVWGGGGLKEGDKEIGKGTNHALILYTAFECFFPIIKRANTFHPPLGLEVEQDREKHTNIDPDCST